jgi:hypothetical protein
MTKFSKIALCATVIGAFSFFTSCNNEEENPTTPVKASIYERLGGTTKQQDPRGTPGVMIEKGRLAFRSVVDTTINLIVADIVNGANGNLGAHFAPIVGEVLGGNSTNVAVLSKDLTDFFSANTGGGATNTYTGLDMIKAHDPATNPRMGTKSNTADYNKFEGYVGLAANKNGVAANTELYADVVVVLESLRTPIVQK